MKKLFIAVLVLSALMLLGSVGFGCGDANSQEFKSPVTADSKCGMVLDVNAVTIEADGVFYLPEIDAFVVRHPDLTEELILRDTVNSFYLHK